MRVRRHRRGFAHHPPVSLVQRGVQDVHRQFPSRDDVHGELGRVERLRPIGEPALIGGGCDVALGSHDDVRAIDLILERLRLHQRPPARHLRHVDERDRRGDAQDLPQVFVLERVVHAAGVAQAGGFDDEAVGLGASEELSHGDGERRGDGAAETSSRDLPDDDAAVAFGGTAAVAFGEPARRVQDRPVDAERAELVHHDGPPLVGRALGDEMADRGGLPHSEDSGDDVDGDRHRASRRPRPCHVYWSSRV